MTELVELYRDLLAEEIFSEDTVLIEEDDDEVSKLVFLCANGSYLELFVDPEDRSYRQGIITTMMDPFKRDAFEVLLSDDGNVEYESQQYNYDDIPWFRAYSVVDQSEGYGMAFMEYLNPEKFNRAYKLQHLDHEIDSPFAYYSRVSYLADTDFRNSIGDQKHWDPMEWIEDNGDQMIGKLEDAFGNTILFEYQFSDDIDQHQPLDIDFVLEDDLSYKFEGKYVDVIATGTLMTFSFKLGAKRMDIT